MIIIMHPCDRGLRAAEAIGGSGPTDALGFLRSRFPHTKAEDMRIINTRDVKGTPMQLCFDAREPGGISVILSGDEMLPPHVLNDLQ
jgi:hypothetical protein